MNLVTYLLYGFIALGSFRLLAGPSVQDRLMALSMLSSLVVLLMCVFAVILRRSLYLDVAIIYALLSFAEILAILRFQQAGPARRKEKTA